jgi:hypothetical protein
METAALVGFWLLQGAISYVGGQLMASALGGARISDVQTWIAEAVAELEAFVSAELRRQLTELILNQMRADLDGIIQNLTEYSRLRKRDQATNRFLLESSDTKTASLVPLSLDYDQALFISFSAVAYRFFALFGLYERDRDPGHITFARPSVDNFINKAMAARDRIEKALNPGTRLVKHLQFYPGDPDYPATEPGPSTDNYITLDGKVVWHDNTQDLDNRQVNAAYAKLYPPLEQQCKAFIGNTNANIKLTASCYSDMCVKIGGAPYPVPGFGPPIGPAVSIVSPVITRGAVVIGPID